MSNVLQFQAIILKQVSKNKYQFCSVEKRDHMNYLSKLNNVPKVLCQRALLFYGLKVAQNLEGFTGWK